MSRQRDPLGLEFGEGLGEGPALGEVEDGANDKDDRHGGQENDADPSQDLPKFHR